MPVAAAIPLITKLAPIAGAAFGAIGSSGKQGRVSGNTSSTEKIDQLQETIEPEYWTALRKYLIPAFQNTLEDAAGPVYGDAQKAAAIQDTNEAFDTSANAVRSALARSGRLRSGSLDEAMLGLGSERGRALSGFFSQLPFMEKEQRLARTTPLLQMGMGWAGAAPTSQRMTGTGTRQGTQEQTQYGPSFGRNLAYGMGGMMMRNPNMFGGSWWGGGRDPQSGE